ncbi:Hypothetical protein LUCI_0477 [Lucifera butyrica]|uniref:Uncharacterized protein n=1 Tax=Lucifera butyrica TaxID=1351585 RepID=A0A498R3A3_9FIRM|nr:hypothetical protein [Lucifera butyrica]VBB05270.1 Hypothetical protein LUCI_0477 [Lucifera butyrica]
MNWTQQQWLKAALALLLTLGILYAGQSMWRQQTTTRPLNNALQHIDGVKKVICQDSGQPKNLLTLSVTLDPSANFQKTYVHIQQTAVRFLGNRPFRIRVEDRSTPELEQIDYRAQYYLQQAIMTGNFPRMADKIQEIASNAGVTAHVYVDSQAIYLQLAQGDNSFYTLVPRQAVQGRQTHAIP